MIILILALIFGLAVMIFLVASMGWARRKGKKSKLLLILKIIVLIETIAFIAVFVMVLLRTMAM